MGGMTAAELVAELERRKREDPDFRARLDQAEADRRGHAALLRDAERPLVEDLRALGLEVDTVQDLHKVPDSRPAAIPVLLAHLTRDYPEGVIYGIGQQLNHPSARAWWDELRHILLATDREVVREQAAIVLSNCARRDRYDELLGFVGDASLGESRLFFLRPLHRIGNRIRGGQGRAVIESVATDPDLAAEATAILRGRSPSA